MFRRILVALLLAAFVAPSFGAGATSQDAPACSARALVPYLGDACVVPGGYEVLLPDGTRLFLHGVDPKPPAISGPGPLPHPVACVGADEPHARVVYAVPRGRPPRTRDQVPQIQYAVEQANAVVLTSAAKFGAAPRLKVLCDAQGRPAVDVVELPTGATQDSASSIFADVRGLGYGGPLVKTWIFYDDNVESCNCGGWSNIPGDDAWGPGNPNNWGDTYSVTLMAEFDTTWALFETALHELTHAMGGVQNSSPNTSGGYHCNDGVDIMCYADGGSRSEYTETTCPAAQRRASVTMPYDCGNDDYFHPSPSAGSYLDTRWNVGADYNQFLDLGLLPALPALL